MLLVEKSFEIFPKHNGYAAIALKSFALNLTSPTPFMNK